MAAHRFAVAALGLAAVRAQGPLTGLAHTGAIVTHDLAAVGADSRALIADRRVAMAAVV